MSGAVLKAQRDTGSVHRAPTSAIQSCIVASRSRSSMEATLSVAGDLRTAGVRELVGFGEALSEYPTTFSPSVSGFWLKRRVWLSFELSSFRGHQSTTAFAKQTAKSRRRIWASKFPPYRKIGMRSRHRRPIGLTGTGEYGYVSRCFRSRTPSSRCDSD